MTISKLIIKQLRNLLCVEVEPSNQFNLLIGENGSGKTSFLEAIYFLSLARSFRSHLYKPIITHHCEQLTVSGVVHHGISLGIEKNRQGKVRIKINTELCRHTATLAALLPLQIINPDGYKILEAGPQFRRKFLDWGVFHVKHPFFNYWQRGNLALRQRNAALRQEYSRSQISLWDKELNEIAEMLHRMRHDYLKLLQPIFNRVISDLLSDEINLEYYCGWDKEKSLSEVMEHAYERDRHLGYTQFGYHRADLIFTVNQLPVTQVLSRGQQKILVCALKIAQGILLQQQSNKSCIYLIDDLAAELDSDKRNNVIKLLNDLKTQVFITSIEGNSFMHLDKQKDLKVFHVKHGCITEAQIYI